MDFRTFCRELELDDRDAENIFPGFGESARLFAEDEQNELTDAYLDRVLAYIGLAQEDESALRRFAARIRNSPAEKLLFFHAERTLFFGADPKAICSWPDFRPRFGDDWHLFYLLLSCAVFAAAAKSFRAAGIPEENLRLIGRKISGSSWINKEAFGVPGYDRNAIYWLRHYVTLAVIPVGRFEFRLGTAQTYGIEVFRRRSDGAILALAAGNGGRPYGFRADGEACPPDAPDAVSCGALIKNADFAIGHALDAATGRSLGVVKLPLSEWEALITAQTPVLEWHIPGGGGMTPEVTGKSLKAGVEFFERHFPDLPSPAAVMCSSWAFWHRYEELRPQANPSLVMRECYEFGRPIRNYSGFYFIFGAKSPAELPGEPRRDTSIRRTMLDVLEREGALGTGGVFILKEDLTKWGSSPYRNGSRCRDWQNYLITAAAER